MKTDEEGQKQDDTSSFYICIDRSSRGDAAASLFRQFRPAESFYLQSPKVGPASKTVLDVSPTPL